jgi:hypothetical protein
MSNRTFTKVVYSGIFNSMRAANRSAFANSKALQRAFSSISVGVDANTEDGPGDGATLTLGVVFQSPTDSKHLNLVKDALDKNQSIPYTLSGLLYHHITVEDATAEETADINKMLDDREAQKKRDAEQTSVSDMPAGLASLVAALEARGAEVTVIRL